MCIINSCQPDIKICFFSLLPLFPTSTYIPQARHMFYSCYFRTSSQSSSVILRSHGVFASHQPLSPRGDGRSLCRRYSGWAFPGGGEGFIIGIVGTEVCRRGHYEDPWRLPAGEHGCREKKRTEKSFGFMRAWV